MIKKKTYFVIVKNLTLKASVGIYPKYSKKRLIRILTESFKSTFEIVWDTRDWNAKELKFIADCEKNYKPL